MWVGLELNKKPKSAASLRCVSLLLCQLTNWSINERFPAKTESSLSEVIWASGLKVIYLSVAAIMLSTSASREIFRNTYSAWFVFAVRFRSSELHLPRNTFSCFSSYQASLLYVYQWWNVLLLPSLSHRCLCLSAWGLWDCGRAALPWQQAVLPNCVHLGFGVSLRSLPLSYLVHLPLRFSFV